MEALLDCCCGIDVYDNMIETCIIKGATDEPEIIHRQFKTLPQDLKEFALWLSEYQRGQRQRIVKILLVNGFGHTKVKWVRKKQLLLFQGKF